MIQGIEFCATVTTRIRVLEVSVIFPRKDRSSRGRRPMSATSGAANLAVGKIVSGSNHITACRTSTKLAPLTSSSRLTTRISLFNNVGYYNYFPW